MFARLVFTGLSLIKVVFGAFCDRTFTSSSGIVTSPDYQSLHNYANNLNCEYDIRVSSGNAIRLTWTSFDIKGKMPSCYDDYVEIFIGCNRHSIGRYCSENSDATPFDVYSSDNCLRLKFKSDSSGTGKGFTATYSTVSYSFGTNSLSVSCSKSESKYSNSGVINSPKWPRVYTTIGSCYWKIEVGSNKAVKIAFMDFNLDYDIGCDDDKVKVKGGHSYISYDDSSTVKDSMCGSKSPFYFTSSKERIWIRFRSDGSRSNRGFVAGYVTYYDPSGSLSSTGATVGGIVGGIVVFICIGGGIFGFSVYRRRVAMRQAAHHQAMTTQVNVTLQQAVVHHPPPPPTQPGHGPPPPVGYVGPPAGGSAPPVQAGHHQTMTTQVNVTSQQSGVHHTPPPTHPGYGPSSQMASVPPPAGGSAPGVHHPPPPTHPGYGPSFQMAYVPPPAGGSAPVFQRGVAPPPYSQVVEAPYPQQDKSGPYSPPGAAAYHPGQAGETPFYPPGQPGGMAPYLPAQSQGVAPYPPEPSAPYLTEPPGGSPYPPK